MKKLILLIAIAISITACKCKPNESNTSALTRKGIKQVSLDGVDSIHAINWIKTFNNCANASLVPSSFLIKKDTLHKLVHLLLDELAYERANKIKDTTDGIRIYFAINPKTPTVVSLLIVSTRDSVNEDPNDMVVRHRDYYTHSSTADLIKLNMTDEIIYPSTTPGATLNATCPTCGDDPNCNLGSNLDYLKRADAERMVQSYNLPVIPAGTMQTRSEWFKLASIKAIDDDNCDGLRIYFARHDPNDRKYPSMACFILTTTKKDPSDKKVYKDYYDCNTLGPSFTDHELKSSANSIPLPPHDNGELCPNNCD